MKKLLPLKQPPIISYYTYMYRLGILATRDEYLPWLYSNHIQLLARPGENLNFYTHPWCTTPRTKDACLSTCPLLDSTSLDKDTWDLAIRHDPVGYVIECIDRGYYVLADEDDFYVPGRIHYYRGHLLHELLVIGYDTAATQLYTAGFYQGRFALSSIAFDQFKRAVTIDIDFMIERTRATGGLFRRKHENMLERPQATLYRYNEHASVSFDRISVFEQIHDYVHATNTSWRYRLVVPPVEGAAWGMQAYDFLNAHLADVIAGKAAFNPIFIRIFFEHKTVMASRLQYMDEHGHAGFSSIVPRYEDLAKEAQNLHLLMYRWTKNRRDETIKTARKKLADMARVEGTLLRQILSAA